jgi:hypothetical protein
LPISISSPCQALPAMRVFPWRMRSSLPIHGAVSGITGGTPSFLVSGTYKPLKNYLFNLGVFCQSEPILKIRFSDSRVFWRIIEYWFWTGADLTIFCPSDGHFSP